jgi:hypothetical protein
MEDKKSSESRRKLLKSIAAGSGAIVAGKSLPESWNRPVVDSVILPAHAQTSCTLPLLLSDIFSDCSIHNVTITYHINDDGACPVLIQGDPPLGSTAEAFNLGSYGDGTDGAINLDPSQPGGTTFEVTCATGVLVGGSASPGAIPAFNVLSTSGIDYAFSGIYSILPLNQGVSATNMQLSPLP